MSYLVTNLLLLVSDPTLELKDWLNSINYNKEDIATDETIRSYPPYRQSLLVGHIDCIKFANEMNMYHQLPKDMQYKFYQRSEEKEEIFLDKKG